MLAGLIFTLAVIGQVSKDQPVAAAADPPSEAAVSEIPPQIREYLERSEKLHSSRIADAESRVDQLERLIANSKAAQRAKIKADLRAAERYVGELKSEPHPKSLPPAGVLPGEIGYVDVFQRAFVLDNTTLIAAFGLVRPGDRNVAITNVGTRSIKFGRTDDFSSGQFWRYEGYVRVLSREVSDKIRKDFPEARDILIAVEPVKTLEVEGFWKAFRAAKTDVAGEKK